MASSLFNLGAWQSFSTTSVQVLFGLPLGVGPSASYSIYFFTQSSSSSRNTGPYHRSLLCCNTNVMSSIPNLSLGSLVGNLSSINQINMICWCRCLCWTMTPMSKTRSGWSVPVCWELMASWLLAFVESALLASTGLQKLDSVSKLWASFCPFFHFFVIFVAQPQDFWMDCVWSYTFIVWDPDSYFSGVK